MRIGEIAGLIGLSTRAIRHYHRVGLLPEPAREGNGYRMYGVRDAVTLARIKRLTELGLSLDEVRDVLADDQGRELPEVLAELDADLAREEERIRRRRERLADLLKQDSLHPDDPVSDDMAAVLGRLPRVATGVVATEREWLALLDVTMPASDRSVITGVLGSLGEDPELVQAMQRIYVALDELADAAPDDARVGRLAEELAGGILQPVVDMLSGEAGFDFDADADQPEVQGFLDELAPAQATVLRQAFTLLARKARR